MTPDAIAAELAVVIVNFNTGDYLSGAWRPWKRTAVT